MFDIYKISRSCEGLSDSLRIEAAYSEGVMEVSCLNWQKEEIIWQKQGAE